MNREPVTVPDVARRLDRLSDRAEEARALAAQNGGFLVHRDFLRYGEILTRDFVATWTLLVEGRTDRELPQWRQRVIEDLASMVVGDFVAWWRRPSERAGTADPILFRLRQPGDTMKLWALADPDRPFRAGVSRCVAAPSLSVARAIVWAIYPSADVDLREIPPGAPLPGNPDSR